MPMKFKENELDFERLPQVLAVMFSHDDSLWSAFTSGELLGRVAMGQFDETSGLAPIYIDDLKVGAVHYGRLLRGVPLDLSDRPPTVLPRPE